jgi:hypothetical protein
MTIKSTYERPALTKVGSLEAITKSTLTGSKLDASFNGTNITSPSVLS